MKKTLVIVAHPDIARPMVVTIGLDHSHQLRPPLPRSITQHTGVRRNSIQIDLGIGHIHS